MIKEIVLSIVCFLFFIYVFIFKLIKKNDTTYLAILMMQTLGILLNFIQIIFNVLTGFVFRFAVYILCIIIPIILFILEWKKINISEFISISVSKAFLFFNKTKNAKDILIRLTSKYDKSYFAHKLLAEIYQKEGGMRKAIDEYIKVLDIKNDDYESYFNISKLLKDLEKKDEAIQMLLKLTKKKPELYEANLMLGNLLMEKGKFKEAATVYIQAIKYNDDNAELYYDLGLAYSRINEFPLAKKCFEKTVEIDSNFYNAYYRMGQIALLYRDIENAEINFLQSMYGETEGKSYYKLSKIYMIKNDKNKAVMFINKAIEFNPKYYEDSKNEPIFFSIKKEIEEPKSIENNLEKESDKEKEISDYLDNTYDLTKALDEKNNKKKKI